MESETFSSTSGKEFTVHRHPSNGEIESISWIDGSGKHTLSENEIFDLYNWITDEDDDDDDDEDGTD